MRVSSLNLQKASSVVQRALIVRDFELLQNKNTQSIELRARFYIYLIYYVHHI